MNLSINKKDVEGSFDSIASNLLRKKALLINNTEIRFTEIEFYYFGENHQDNYTHKHKRGEGEWRFHNQGLDITFQGNDTIDGGILIRGIFVDGEFINGPRRVVGRIFEILGNVNNESHIVLKDSSERHCEITKTFRHLPNKVYPDFHHKPYRYLTDLDILEIIKSEKELIRNNSIEL